MRHDDLQPNYSSANRSFQQWCDERMKN